MMYATKKNIQVKIDDDQAEVYAKQGYTIIDKDGNPVACSYHAPVPYEEHVKALERIAELEAELAAKAEDDFQ